MVYQPLRSPVFALDAGVVASEHVLASLAGVKVLERGGNAVDAAIAVSFTLAVVLPHLGGIGGDFFALVWRDARVYFFNGSCGAPRRLAKRIEELGLKEVPEHGPLSINVPGMVEGLHLLWKRLGSLEWRELVKPAIELARKGFPMSHGLARAISSLQSELEKDEGSRNTYLAAKPKPSMVVSFKGLAGLLEAVAEDPRSFYEGEPAEAIVEYVSRYGGVLELDDLRGCRAEEAEPIRLDYRGYTVYEMPPNTQGVTTLHVLALMERFGVSKLKRRSREWVEMLLKIYGAAYWARDSFVGDPAYMEKSVEELLSPSFIDELAKRAGHEPAWRVRGDGDTTFYAVADAEGTVVAGIQSLFHPFGSYITEPRFQVTLNSRASGFTVKPGHVNRVEPGKKPLHTLSAMILERGGTVIGLGLSGGHFRPQLHSQLIDAIVDRGMDVQQAIEEPRFVWHPGETRITAEQGVATAIPGYTVEVRRYPSRLGVAAAVVAEGRVRKGYVDVRGDGVAVPQPWF